MAETKKPTMSRYNFKFFIMKNNFLNEMSIEDLEERNEFTAVAKDASCDITIDIDICPK